MSIDRPPPINVKRQRTEAVRVLQQRGFTFDGLSWVAPLRQLVPATAHNLHTELVARADDLMGAPDGSQEAAELAAVTAAIQALEAHLWPGGGRGGGD